MQRQIDYKARWEGVKVIYVPAGGTSKRCSICGYKTLESTQRQLSCPKCDTILDRDVNAARNLAAGGLRFSPDGPPVEAMVEEREPENATPILKVDRGKPSQQPTKATTHRRRLGITESLILFRKNLVLAEESPRLANLDETLESSA